MKHLFYEDWTNKRVKRLIDIFGKSWFKGKTVLELGSAHGDIGIELLKLGADVTFTDVRNEHLESIVNRLRDMNFSPKVCRINQNESYDLLATFDLILHIGVLYHVENWQQDLECALKHSNTMILESAVHPSPSLKHPIYGPYECDNPSLTEEGIEEHLTNLGCKFLRFDILELDSIGHWLTTDVRDNHHYSWNQNNVNNSQHYGEVNHYRRYWLVLR
jgi:hypothetical protein